jgi:hypothetical protein
VLAAAIFMHPAVSVFAYNLSNVLISVEELSGENYKYFAKSYCFQRM